MRYIVTNKYYDVFEKKKKKKKQTKIMPGAAPWGGGGKGGKSPPKDFKKGENKKYGVFSCIKVIKISFSVIFNEEIVRALEGLLSRF